TIRQAMATRTLRAGVVETGKSQHLTRGRRPVQLPFWRTGGDAWCFHRLLCIARMRLVKEFRIRTSANTARNECVATSRLNQELALHSAPRTYGVVACFKGCWSISTTLARSVFYACMADLRPAATQFICAARVMKSRTAARRKYWLISPTSSTSTPPASD